jgi:hypothetical protein
MRLGARSPRACRGVRDSDSRRSAIPLWPSRFTPGNNHGESCFLRTNRASSSLACGASWARVSIVSDDEQDTTEAPAVGVRRVSMRLAIIVVVGCAVLGLIIGVFYPLRPNIRPAQKAEEPANLTLASAKPVENPPAAAQPRLSTSLPMQPEQPESVAAGNALPKSHALAPATVASVSTGSVDRSPPPGASQRAVLAASDRQAAARSEPEAHRTSQRHRAARAKRLKRVLWRRMRSKPPGMTIDAFFSSLFPKI